MHTHMLYYIIRCRNAMLDFFANTVTASLTKVPLLLLLLITTTTTTTANNNTNDNNNNNSDNDRPLRQPINRRFANPPFGFYRLPNEGAKLRGSQGMGVVRKQLFRSCFTLYSLHVQALMSTGVQNPFLGPRLLPLILISHDAACKSNTTAGFGS